MEQKPKQKTVKGMDPEVWWRLKELATKNRVYLPRMIEMLIEHWEKTKEE